MGVLRRSSRCANLFSVVVPHLPLSSELSIISNREALRHVATARLRRWRCLDERGRSPWRGRGGRGVGSRRGNDEPAASASPGHSSALGNALLDGSSSSASRSAKRRIGQSMVGSAPTWLAGGGKVLRSCRPPAAGGQGCCAAAPPPPPCRPRPPPRPFPSPLACGAPSPRPRP